MAQGALRDFVILLCQQSPGLDEFIRTNFSDLLHCVEVYPKSRYGTSEIHLYYVHKSTVKFKGVRIILDNGIWILLVRDIFAHFFNTTYKEGQVRLVLEEFELDNSCVASFQRYGDLAYYDVQKETLNIVEYALFYQYLCTCDWWENLRIFA